MKYYQNTLSRVITAAAFIAVSAQASAVVGPSVDLYLVGPNEVSVGESFQVDLMVDGLYDFDLSAFDVDVSFDNTLFSFNSSELGTELGKNDLVDPSNDSSQGESAPGLVNVGEVSSLLDLSAQSDGFVLATLNIDALAVGGGVFEIAFDELTDDFGDPVFANIQSLSVNVAEVPVPAAAWLFGSALLGLFGSRRKSS